MRITLRSASVAAASAALALALGTDALAAFSPGDVIAASGNGTVKQFTNTGTFIATLDDTTASSYMTGMCFDSSFNLYVTNFSGTTVSKFNSNGSLANAQWATGLASPEACVRDSSGNFYISQVGGTGIRKTDSNGATITTFLTGRTDFIELAADQCTMLFTTEGSSIFRYNVCTNTAMSNFTTNTIGSGYALRIRPNGDVLVADGPSVKRFDSGGNLVQTYAGSGFTPAAGGLFAFNLDPDGTTFWTGDYNNGYVYRINIATGTQVTSFNTSPATGMYGVAVVGEVTVAVPTATPTPQGGGATATPTPTPEVNPTAALIQGIPTLDNTRLTVLALILAVAGLLLAKRVIR